MCKMNLKVEEVLHINKERVLWKNGIPERCKWDFERSGSFKHEKTLAEKTGYARDV